MGVSNRNRNRVISNVTVITQPTIEPVTLAEVKEVLRISNVDDDDLIDGYIRTARIWAENYTDLYFMTQVIEITMDTWPGYVIALGSWPIQSVDSVKYDDTSSPITEQTLTENTDYYVDVVSPCGFIDMIDTLPSLTTRPNAVKIRLTVGYEVVSVSPEDLRNGVPESIKTAIKLYVKSLYDSDPCTEATARAVIHHMRNKCV